MHLDRVKWGNLPHIYFLKLFKLLENSLSRTAHSICKAMVWQENRLLGIGRGYSTLILFGRLNWEDKHLFEWLFLDEEVALQFHSAIWCHASPVILDLIDRDEIRKLLRYFCGWRYGAVNSKQGPWYLFPESV